MHAAELVNRIQQRLRRRVEFKEITVGHNSTATFVWGNNQFMAIGGESVSILHLVEPNVAYTTLHSQYLQGIFDGGVRDDEGNLIKETVSERA